MHEDALYYNAVAVALGGDREAIAKLKLKHDKWQRAHQSLARSGAAAPHDPTAAAEKLKRTDVRLILLEDVEYPPLLKEIPDPPFGIYVRGALPPADAVVCAIVGTRRATPEGKNTARRFSRGLAQYNLVIASGLAFGIDAAAHEGCLEARGATVAMLAGGLDTIYPRENERLAHDILQNGGAIISEYPIGSPPYPSRFLERNRIVSGLSRGVLIVEAPFGSGALVTARHALEQNRDVFVVPGPVDHPNFAGSHQLIRQGAMLVTSPEEMLESFGIAPEEKTAKEGETASPEEKLILEALQRNRVALSVDKIAIATKLEPRIVNQALSFLLLRNVVKENEKGYTI
jgi:DNA processing protein